MNNHCQNKEVCYYHPKHVLVGVCPFCLNEKLLVIATKQSLKNKHHQNQQVGSHQTSHSRQPSNVGLPKIFSFGSLLDRFELRRHNRSGTYYDCDEDGGWSDSQSTSTSLEDSFISIKFGGNGVASWDKNEVSKGSQDHKGFHKQSSWKSYSNKSVIEHSKTPRGSLRWRKRIGHFLQLVRWKRPNKASNGVSHADGLGVGGAVKVRNRGWMRSLTKRRNCKE